MKIKYSIVPNSSLPLVHLSPLSNLPPDVSPYICRLPSLPDRRLPPEQLIHSPSPAPVGSHGTVHKHSVQTLDLSSQMWEYSFQIIGPH